MIGTGRNDMSKPKLEIKPYHIFCRGIFQHIINAVGKQHGCKQ